MIGADAAGKRLIDGAATDNPWAYAFPQWSLDGERIAYHAGLPGHISDIFVAAVDGSGTEAIGDLTENLVWPVWSPDGARIAYSGPATSDGMSQIGVMDADGTNIETLDHPSLGCNCAFGWSPDGTKVIASQDAPVAGAGAHPALMVIDVTGSAPVGVIPSEGVTSQEASWQRLAP
ncbi:MAG: hypothetical protein LH650_11280 [Chloroflexi bacterium]|nr:hypothetical protein [Chloroflexota bacterium]